MSKENLPALTDEQIKGLKRLMEPFDKSEISKLPKPTAAQTKEVKDDYKKGIRCEVCGGWHHKNVVHLDYVGHAALTKRLLEVDPLWNWEPFAVNEIGEPRLDAYGGMWGWLTVCGVTRRGYGDSEGKTGSNANKERIGDFLRNAAMRFGAALDLWSKADLTKLDIADDDGKTGGDHADQKKEETKSKNRLTQWLEYVDAFTDKTLDQWNTALDANISPALKKMPEEDRRKMQIAIDEMTKYLTEKENGK